MSNEDDDVIESHFGAIRKSVVDECIKAFDDAFEAMLAKHDLSNGEGCVILANLFGSMAADLVRDAPEDMRSRLSADIATACARAMRMNLEQSRDKGH